MISAVPNLSASVESVNVLGYEEAHGSVTVDAVLTLRNGRTQLVEWQRVEREIEDSGSDFTIEAVCCYDYWERHWCHCEDSNNLPSEDWVSALFDCSEYAAVLLENELGLWGQRVTELAQVVPPVDLYEEGNVTAWAMGDICSWHIRPQSDPTNVSWVIPVMVSVENGFQGYSVLIGKINKNEIEKPNLEHTLICFKHEGKGADERCKCSEPYTDVLVHCYERLNSALKKVRGALVLNIEELV